MSVFGEVEGVIRAADGGLEVAQQRVDGLELRQLHAGLAAAGDVALVFGPDDARRAANSEVMRPGAFAFCIVFAAAAAQAPQSDAFVELPAMGAGDGIRQPGVAARCAPLREAARRRAPMTTQLIRFGIGSAAIWGAAPP